MIQIKQSGLTVGLPFLTVAVLAGVWEFYLEDRWGPLLFAGYRQESAWEHLGYVAVSLASAAAALLILGAVSYRLAARSEGTRRALAASEGRFRDLIEGSVLATMIRSKTGERLYANQAFLDLFGYESVEEVINDPDMPLTAAPHERERLTGYRLARLRGEDSPSSYEFDGRRKNGSIVPIQTFVRSLEWDGREAIQNIYIDITERRAAEWALKDSEARYRDLIEGSDLGIQIGSRGSGRVFANRACCEIFGYESVEELMTTPGLQLVAEHDRALVNAYTNSLFGGKNQSVTYEFDGLRKDGTVIRVQAFARRILWDGHDAIQRTFIDLTDQRRAEQQLRQAQKMEAVGQLTGGVAHDFNNLLTVILGNLELVVDELREPAQQSQVRSAIRAAQRGADLTQRLLSYARRQALMPGIIDLDALTDGMVELMRRTLGETIEIEIRSADGLWQCEADPGQLENAILNLALNARDAMPRGGRLTIGMANRTLDVDDAEQLDTLPGDYAMISVTDEGTGIPEAVLGRVFEPFFTTKGVGEGSGLGLSMVQGFARQSGGAVTIDSAAGRGTAVTLFLPRAEAAENQREEAEFSADGPVWPGRKILIVEDDPELRVLTVSMLAGAGYDPVAAGNGKEAMEILDRTQDFDLLLTDVVLPGGMNGADLAQEANRFVPKIKVLFTSGYSENILAKQGNLDPGIRLIRKPFRRAELMREVRRALTAP